MSVISMAASSSASFWCRVLYDGRQDSNRCFRLKVGSLALATHSDVLGEGARVIVGVLKVTPAGAEVLRLAPVLAASASLPELVAI